MKIYRFVPNGRDYAPITRPVVGRFWPDGIDMGPVFPDIYPDAHGSPRGYRLSWPGAPMSDFPAFALNLPMISAHAARVLGSLVKTVPTTVDDQPIFAVQPLLQGGGFVASASRALALPRGEPLLYTARAFDPAAVPGEFFTIAELSPFSDLYVTERLVDAARTAGLTGLECLELVWDDHPVEVRYPPVPREAIPRFTLRRDLEHELLKGRCDFGAYDSTTAEAAIDDAVVKGYVAFEFVEPLSS
jgi:hypothetical protein